MRPVTVAVPTSKSETQRALVLAALAGGRSVVRDPADSTDVRVLLAALRELGVAASGNAARLAVDGGGVLQAPVRPLRLGNAGTAVRFVAGLAPVVHGELAIDGCEAMRRRPMPGLLAALRRLGVYVEERGLPGCPPVSLRATGARPPTELQVDPTGSSQQVSALMLVAPRLTSGLVLRLTESPPSVTYLWLTTAIMRDFGCDVVWESYDVVRIAPGGPWPTTFAVSPDRSAAAFLLAAARVSGRELRFLGHGAELPPSRQGDARFPAVLETFRATAELPGRTIDLRETPDLVPPTVAVALFEPGETRVVGVEHARIKECDRLAVLARELPKLGADVRADAPGEVVVRGPLASPELAAAVELDPEDDHRMAMAFGVVSLRLPPGAVRVRSPGCVDKSFPSWWEQLEAFR